MEFKTQPADKCATSYDQNDSLIYWAVMCICSALVNVFVDRFSSNEDCVAPYIPDICLTCQIQQSALILFSICVSGWKAGLSAFPNDPIMVQKYSEAWCSVWFPSKMHVLFNPSVLNSSAFLVQLCPLQCLISEMNSKITTIITKRQFALNPTVHMSPFYLFSVCRQTDSQQTTWRVKDKSYHIFSF